MPGGTARGRLLGWINAAWASRLVAVVLAGAGALVHAAAPDARIALIVGNAAYKSAPLANPVNDARAIARSLKDLGFEVDLQENLSQQAFMQALRRFGARLKETGGTGLFYYAGHGMQVKGANYLIPVDAGIQSEDEVRYLAIDANQVLDKMDQAGNRLNIVILDACRDNPFARSFRSKQSGLAQMDAPSGVLIAFATAPGAVAYDGDGANGVYTKHLLRNLTIPGLPVELVLKRVREGVAKDTDSKQIPWESSSLLGDFYFKGGATSMAPTATADAAAVELAFWDSVKESGAAGEYRAYLEQYPSGKFAPIARERINNASAAPTKRAEPPAAQLALARPGGTPAAAPTLPIQAGDTWTYALLDRRYKTDSITVTVSAVDGNQIEERLALGKTRAFKVRREFRWGMDAEQSFQEVELPGKVFLVDLAPYAAASALPPLGTEWRVEGVRITFVGDVPKGATNITVRVAARERIKVPAGEFDTVRIDARTTELWSQGGIRTYLVLSYWYSEAERRFVKAARRQISNQTTFNSEDVLELERRDAAPAQGGSLDPDTGLDAVATLLTSKQDRQGTQLPSIRPGWSSDERSR